MRKGCIVLGAWLCAACAPTESERRVEQRTAASDKRSAPTPRRGKVLGGERVRRVVQWPADTLIDERSRALLSTQARTKVDGLQLPVLVSSRDELAGGTQVMTGPRWYATWAQHEGLTITLNASGESRVYPDIKPFAGNRAVRGTDGFVTQNESVWSVTWIEHGVAYDLGLECESPTMPQCQDGAYAVGLAEDLVFVGPKEANR